MQLRSLIEEIDFTPEYDSSALEKYLREDLSQQYKVAYDPPESMAAADRGNESDGLKEGLQELVQHLADLAYLEEMALNNFQVSNELPADLAEALQVYWREDTQLAAEFNSRTIDPHDAAFAEFLPVLNERLSLLTSFDGELKLNQGLAIGDRNIYTRIIHFRLKVYGLYSLPTSEPASDATIIGLCKIQILLKNWDMNEYRQAVFGRSADSGLLNSCGNAYHLLEQLIKNKKRPLLFYRFTSADVPLAKIPYIWLADNKLVFSKEKKEFKSRMRHAGRPISEWKEEEVKDLLAYDDWNLFSSYLFQVVLWMNGYYYGRLDGLWGEKTHQALTEFLAQEDMPRDEHLIPIEGGLWVLNVQSVAQRLLSYQNAASLTDQEDYLADVAEETQSPVRLSDEVAQENEKKARTFFEKIKSIGRRIYYGARSLIASAIKGVKKVWQFLRDEVIGPAASFFRHLFRQIRQAIKSFFEGVRRFIHFVLHKPVITLADQHFVIARFDVDFDAMQYVSANCPTATITAHRDMVSRLTHQLAMFMLIAGKAIGLIVSLQPPIGYVKLALKLGKIVIDVIRDNWKKKGA